MVNNLINKKPILIYDGECKFCYYWIQYWQKLTNDKVSYKPYQEIAASYPSISIKSFQRAVQYIDEEGNISSAAEASFKTLSHVQGKTLWLSLYKNLPFFAFLSEKMYTLISQHRSFFYFICILLWGKHLEPSRYTAVTWILLRLLGVIFFSAFISFGSQAIGLIGSHGISPLTDLIHAGQTQLGAIRYWMMPMIFWVYSSDLFIQIICYAGAGFSILLMFNIIPRISLFFIYLLYLSLIYAGQSFMTYQWDMLLLETSILAFYLIRPTALGIGLFRWLLFRFFFVSGLVKILSGDRAWQANTTLSYHFQTQPLPTPMAWYAHQFPQALLNTMSGMTLFIELIIPFLFFAPRNIRFIAAYFVLVFQCCILLTGNYNFFNLLPICLCIILFDDAAIRNLLPNKIYNAISLPTNTKRNKFFTYFAEFFAGYSIYISTVQFYLKFIGKLPSILTWSYLIVAPFGIVNTYGPFAVITTQRMEIIIEGSQDGINWKEYSFIYKPDNIYKKPLWNIPHQPRLDWQMWFGALSIPEDQPWFMHFMQRLLENSSSVIALLRDNPFPDLPPTYIRAQYYEYSFTNQDEKNKSGAWWNRRLVRLYLPEVKLR